MIPHLYRGLLVFEVSAGSQTIVEGTYSKSIGFYEFPLSDDSLVI